MGISEVMHPFSSDDDIHAQIRTLTDDSFSFLQDTEKNIKFI